MSGGTASELERSVECFKDCVVEGCKLIDIDMWPLLNLVDSKIRSKINLIYSFGPSATEVVFTTTENNVSIILRTLFVIITGSGYDTIG